MKRNIIRLTENDLNNIVKNVIKEICEIDDLKKQQMDDDWNESDEIDKWDRMYFDRLMDDNYHNDYNGNVTDYWKEKENFPF